MLFSNFKLKTKTSIIISLSLTFTGIVFILASNYIGTIAIRLAMLVILAFYSANIKMKYSYLTTKEKVNYLLIIMVSLLCFFKPELTMFAIGIILLILAVPPYINAIKSKDYSDVIKLAICGIGMLFSIYCIINSKAALNTVIKIIGIILTIVGCLTSLQFFQNNNQKIYTNISESNSFEDISNI